LERKRGSEDVYSYKREITGDLPRPKGEVFNRKDGYLLSWRPKIGIHFPDFYLNLSFGDLLDFKNLIWRNRCYQLFLMKKGKG